ncbi:MAG: translation initiation factor IF-2 [Actinomycetota bacterium]|nr:translation initiation factor IF-2 [Actinomycetota bacterium]
MSKRIYELASELDINSSKLMDELKEMKVSVKNHFASLDDKTEAALKERLKTPSKPEMMSKDKKSDSKPKVEEKPREEAPAPKPAGNKHLKTEPKADAFTKQAEEGIRVMEGSTVSEIANIFSKNPTEIIKTLMNMGEMATINQPVSREAIEILADEFGLKIHIVTLEEEMEEEEPLQVDVKDLKPRPPVVTVMGHVDHGKTLLLDAIQKTDVVSTEAGGITQHIGAYQVERNEKKITFIDTPGHEAFTAMRARGAKITDIAVLVVAADDGVMPQTVEAIDHVKAAGVPILVAVNKIDKEEANPDKVKQQLTEYGLVPEEWGGDTIFVNVSAKNKINIDELLDMLLLLAEMADIKAPDKGPGYGTVIEAFLDKGKGPVATVLIQGGSLKVGDAVVAGYASGKIRAMRDDKGKKVNVAKPGQPVELTGWSQTPNAGDTLKEVSDEKRARQISEERLLKRRVLEKDSHRHIALEDLFNQIKKGDIRDLNLVVKADTQGSIEALCGALGEIDQTEVKVRVIHKGVGAITETDIMLASASNAVVIGFNVRPDVKAKELSDRENVDVRMYRVIYKVIEDIEAARKGLLKPTLEEVETATVEVKDIFKASKLGTIAGCFVTQGEVNRKDSLRVIRDGTVVFEGNVKSLRRFKDDVNSVKSGLECGIVIDKFSDIQLGDVLEFYKIVEKAAL